MKKANNQWTRDMYAEVLRLYIRGYTLDEIGSKYGVTGNRIAQVRNRAMRAARYLRGLDWEEWDIAREQFYLTHEEERIKRSRLARSKE